MRPEQKQKPVKRSLAQQALQLAQAGNVTNPDFEILEHGILTSYQGYTSKILDEECCWRVFAKVIILNALAGEQNRQYKQAASKR